MNLRPLGYEPNELPDCSTPHQADAPGFPGAAQYSKRRRCFKARVSRAVRAAETRPSSIRDRR